jgi:hypothetical protein
VLDKETVKSSLASTMSSSTVIKLTVLGPVSPAANGTDVIVEVKSVFPAVPT